MNGREPSVFFLPTIMAAKHCFARRAANVGLLVFSPLILPPHLPWLPLIQNLTGQAGPFVITKEPHWEMPLFIFRGLGFGFGLG